MGVDRPRAGGRPAIWATRGPPSAALASGLVAVAVFAWWAAAGGGYAPGTWAPGAVVLLVVFAFLLATGRARDLHGPAAVAVVALGAFTAWSFATIVWADARGDAWDGANRTLLHLVVFALFATARWRPGSAAAVLAAFALATVGVCAVAFAAAVAGDAGDAFQEGRFDATVGYPNAVAALLLTAFWPALLLAATRATPALVRGPLLAAAGVALELVVLTQSRGSVLSGAITVALALLLAPERARLAGALAAVAAPALASLPLLLEVFDASGAAADRALTRAGVAVGVSAAVLTAGGWAWARRDAAGLRRRAAPTAGRRRAAALAVVVVLAAAGAAVAARDRSDVAAVRATAADSRFTGGTQTGRYDLWRVALRQVAEHPLLGAGADNFAHDYVRHRRRLEEPLYPHSAALRVPAQTGLPGTLLFAAFLVAVGAAIRPRAPDGAVAVAAVLAAAAWAAQAAIDWLWEIPALAAPAMACLGLAVALAAPRGAPSHRAAPGAVAPARAGSHRATLSGAAAARPVAPLVVAAVTVVAAASLLLPALAAREIDAAIRGFPADPAAARERLDRARQLNPLSDRADVVAGSLALRAGDDRRAAAAFARALDRDARTWHAHVQLGLLDARAGRPGAAAHLARARALNPRSPLVRRAAAVAAGGRAVPPTLRAALDDQAVAGPLRRRPAACVPTFAIAADCSAGP